MAKIFCTGSSGFIGHWLVRALKNESHHVTGLDNLSNGNRKYAKECDEFIYDDVIGVTSEMLKGVDWLFHLAALPRVPYSIEHPIETHDANVNQTLHLLMMAKEAGVKKVIYSSSSAVYGGQKKFPSKETDRTIPLSPYAVQKLTGELYCEVFRGVYGLPTASLRYFNVYGEEQPADNPYTGVLTIFRELRAKNKPFIVNGDGLQRRDFTYVQDVVAANILAAKKGEGVYNVGTGVNFSIKEIAEAMTDRIIYGPARPGDPPISLADNTRIKALGWEPQMDLMTWLS